MTQALVNLARKVMAFIPNAIRIVEKDYYADVIFNGYEIQFRERDKRIVVCASFDNYRDFHVKHQDSITMSPDKAPEQMAKDITRRLLPGVIGEAARLFAMKTEADKRQAVIENNVAAFIQASKGMLTPAREDTHKYGDRTLYLQFAEQYGSFYVSEDTVKAEISSLRPEDAIKILGLLTPRRAG